MTEGPGNREVPGPEAAFLERAAARVADLLRGEHPGAAVAVRRAGRAYVVSIALGTQGHCDGAQPLGPRRREVPFGAAEFRAWVEEDAHAIMMGRILTRMAEALGDAP